MNDNTNTRVKIGEVRLSYCHLFTPEAVSDGGDKKYSVALLIPKSNTALVAAIKDAVKAAFMSGVASKFGSTQPAPGTWKNPLRDGDAERPDDETYAGCYFINANSKTAPQIVDKRVRPILDRSEVYSGVYAIVSLSFYAFNTNGNRGVACGLGNIQKVRDGEPLGGRTNAASEFETLDDEDFLS